MFFARNRSERAQPDVTRPEFDALRQRVDELRDGLKERNAEMADIRKDHTALQLQWAELLAKITSWSNRQAALERKRIAKNLDESASQDPTQTAAALTPEQEKAALRKRVYAERGLRRQA